MPDVLEDVGRQPYKSNEHMPNTGAEQNTHTHTPNTQCRWCKLLVEFKVRQDVFPNA